jgi:hypothetical protein
LKNKNKYSTYVWACDFNNNTGEGKLAQLFIRYYLQKYKNEKIVIETPQGVFNFIYGKSNQIKTNKKKINYNFYYKYIKPIVGIFKIYKNKYFLKKKTLYLNFLPMWNILLFLFLPKKTVLGPITGSELHNTSSLRGFVRLIVLSALNFITKIIIFLKYDKLIFSTNLISVNNKNYTNLFQLQYLKALKKRKKTKKDIDFIFYFRKHNNKHLKEEILFINKLISKGYNVKICGDCPDKNKENYLGFLSKGKLQKILDRSRFTLSSQENPFSFFIQDAINSNVRIMFHKNHENYIKNVFKDYYLIDLQNNYSIQQIIKNLKKTKTTKLNKKTLKYKFNI